MHFKSVSDLASDVVRWSEMLPEDIDVVVGIPRSGLLAANLLALHRNAPLGDVDGLIAGRLLAGGERLAVADDVLAAARKVLVIDDSVATGKALVRAKAALASSPYAGKIVWGAVYVAPAQAGAVDHYYAKVPLPRAFEWNILHHGELHGVCMDIDGVLCRDPLESENDDGARYAEFLSSVRPRLVPKTTVGWLVTARLERYRADTEQWLAGAGIRYGELLMHPAATAAERRSAADHAAHKARAYRRTGAWLFIESSMDQAIEIATLAKRPVYCTDARTMVYPGGATTPGLADRRRTLTRKVARKVARSLSHGLRIGRLGPS